MRRWEWLGEENVAGQMAALCDAARVPGFLVVVFKTCGSRDPLPWRMVEPWTRSRAVTVADISVDLGSPALEVALCADLVYLRESVELRLSQSSAPPPPGILWALGRAGRAALARGLLQTRPWSAEEAVEKGIAQAIVPEGASLPISSGASVAAVTAARDLMRASQSGGPGLGLELATFRLLFAAGDTEEGARAFLGKRRPSFGSGG